MNNDIDFMDFDKKAKEKKEDPFAKQAKEKEEKPIEKKEKKEEIPENFEEIKAKYEKLKVYEDEGYSKLINHIEENYEGETISEKYAKFTEFENKAKETLPKADELEESKRQYDARMREIDITRTTEWQEKYEKPAEIAKDAFVATLADVDEKGEIRHPEQVGKLASLIFNEGKEISGGKVKAILKKYAEDYETATGEEFEAPSIRDVMRAREQLIEAAQNRSEAFANWEERTKESKQRSLIEQQEQSKKVMEAEYADRKSQFSQFKTSFDHSAISGFFEKDKVETVIDSVFQKSEEIISGKATPRTYQEILDNAVKAELFDELLNQAKIDRSFVTEHKGFEDDGREVKPGERAYEYKPKEKKKSFFDI